MTELPRDKKILVLCAHPDDDTFGMGASIREMARNGCSVICAYLTTSPRGVLGDMTEEEKARTRIQEAREACEILGAEPVFMDFHKDELDEPETLERIIDIVKKLKPDAIFTLPGNDVHPTHAKTAKLAHMAAKELGLGEVWIYEAWTLIREPNCVYFFGENEMKVKRDAMSKHMSQLERQGPTDEAFACLNRFRAIMVREPIRGFGGKHPELGKYAEAFLVEKLTRNGK